MVLIVGFVFVYVLYVIAQFNYKKKLFFFFWLRKSNKKKLNIKKL